MRVEGNPDDFAAYGGVDIVVYRVPHPLAFLKAQHDLHQVQVPGHYVGEGVGNTLSFLWDRWFAKSRMIWQQLFTTRARSAVVTAAPQLKQAPPQSYHPHYDHPPQYAPLTQFPMVESFRYPVQQAQPIAPPSDVKLQGSSSNFIAPAPGNVYVPLGKLKPGLYLVEAYLGAHRAITTLFVSDTVGVTKVARGQMLVWTADRTSGAAVPGVDLLWTDGDGVMESGRSGGDGLLGLNHTVPQTSYVIGKDPAGGVFVSENFYYDSEVYGQRFYIFTDRPLYKPGDLVHVKIFARDYLGARRSRALPAGQAQLLLLDSAGRQLLGQTVTLDPDTGADADLPLPMLALPGGYELRLSYQDHDYTGMFRVARYSKPQFRVDVDFARPDYHPGDTIHGAVRLHYPDGRAVTHAKVQLDIRAQALSITDNDTHTRFVQQLAEQSLTSGPDGVARFSLPAAAVPSRYTLHVVASEYGAFPVSARTQLELQPGPLPDTLAPATAPQRPGPLDFALGQSPKAAPAVRWTAVRLEDRSILQGELPAKAAGFKVDFAAPGGYSLFVHAADGSVLAHTQVQVPGGGEGTAVGLRLRADRARYRIGDTAHLTLDFPQPVTDALLTLEREGIAHRALASRGGDWFTLHKESPTRWRVDIPVRDDYAPNMTFSALYVSQGNFEFQNLGLQVQLPAIQVRIKPERSSYRPGERVNVDLTTTRAGKPVPAVVTASVVDNMVYVLQPELAPSIFNFFFHPLRDDVRTTASLSFYGYDLAWSPKAADLGPDDIYHRNDKSPTVQARPRRDNIDTAFWQPSLRTDTSGHARFSFVMPDALSLWRITARAMNADGSVGQGIDYVESRKPYYLKWTGPTRIRPGDRPTIGVEVYDEGNAIRTATLGIRIGDAAPSTRELKLMPGANIVPLPLSPSADTTVHLSLSSGGAVLDALDVPLKVAPAGWPSWHSRIVKSNAPLDLPADATDIRLEPSATLQQQFHGALDALMDYPYGCTEQTASHLIPLSLALQSLPHDEASQPVRLRLQQRLQSERERLMHLAGPGARFSWWGGDGDSYPLLTIYAYYADWRASRALGVSLPATHWRRVFDAYQRGSTMPLLHRALAVHLIQSMGLPVKTLLQGLGDDLAKAGRPDSKAQPGVDDGIFLGAPDNDLGQDLAVLLYRDAARREPIDIPPALSADADVAAKALQDSGRPLLAAMPVLLSPHVAPERIGPILALLDRRAPTMERALMLSWLDQDLQHLRPSAAALALDPGSGWKRVDESGVPQWRYVGRGVPTTLPPQSSAPVAVRLSYRSAVGDTDQLLPVSVKRTLYQLVPGKKTGHFDARPVSGPLRADALYVDQVELVSRSDEPFRYGLLQVPLPPGAQIETQRYGFDIDDLAPIDVNRDQYEPLDVNGNPVLSSMAVLGNEHAQVFDDYYAEPVEMLPPHGKVVLRHLIRVQQPGTFQLPPARYYRMYQPDAKALGPATGHTWTVQ
ncbi:MAG: alpha-2-macroglobulin family protein [Pseudomonadota bacterium]|nr:alpha-2-macroglobulin family protein [Pseudomonadota bacterium]